MKRESLKRRAERAEALQKIAWDRVRKKEEERAGLARRAETAMDVIAILAERLGGNVTILNEEIAAANGEMWVAKILEDGRGFVLKKSSVF